MPAAFPEHNGGVILFRSSPAALGFLGAWRDAYAEAGFKVDQITLRELLWSTDLRFAVLPQRYNCRRYSWAEHWFSRAAPPVILHTNRFHPTRYGAVAASARLGRGAVAVLEVTDPDGAAQAEPGGERPRVALLEAAEAGELRGDAGVAAGVLEVEDAAGLQSRVVEGAGIELEDRESVPGLGPRRPSRSKSESRSESAFWSVRPPSAQASIHAAIRRRAAALPAK